MSDINKLYAISNVYLSFLIIEGAKHERAKKEGKHWGRPKGKKDSRPRCKSGYYQRWSKQGKKVTP